MIYVGLPVRDEEHTAGVILWKLRKLLREEGRDFRVVVVDDASEDRTPEVVDPYRRVLPLTVLRNERRLGYAASLERIVRHVLDASGYHRRDGLVTLQADFTEGPEAIPAMIRRFESGADLVLGAPRPPRAAPGTLLLGRRAAGFLRRFLPVPGAVEDPFGCYRLYRLFVLYRAIEELPSPDDRLLRHEGWASNLELLTAVLPHVRQMDQVEYRADYRRRYRRSRFRLLPELWGLVRASRDERIGARAGGDGVRRAAS